MCEVGRRAPDRTDIAALRAKRDEELDFSDIPRTAAADWKDAVRTGFERIGTKGKAKPARWKKTATAAE